MAVPTTVAHHKIQAAILLDVSNSMDGLIEQAKAQLWNMVNVMGKATCDNITPQIEIALYEYGRPTNNAREGYVKQLSNFTTDLDNLSKTLFTIKTNGGDEYCGHVIWSSLKELHWDTAATNYKVIFIAGNEDFLQGDITYTKACAEATKKGVIVNTIYCGDKMQGISEHWNLAGECGSGSFTNINQDAAIDDIATPYDSTLFSLNDQLNNTYIGYGAAGSSSFMLQDRVDKMNYAMNKSVAVKRVAVKGKKELYKNNWWDLVDAATADSMFVTKVELKTLPDSLQKKSRAELQVIVKEKNMQRGKIQKAIGDLSTKREMYIASEKARSLTINKSSTLENEIEKIIRSQAKRFRIVIP
ncbi:MAG: von Willebrand factor type [Ferruginibacter sp.]|nr:von Willebrand factor type [Ferruginibacter sp.]